MEPCCIRSGAIILITVSLQRLDHVIGGAGPQAEGLEATPAALTAAVEDLLTPLAPLGFDMLSSPLTLSSGPGKTTPVATGMLNIITSICAAAQRRLLRSAWLAAIAAFVQHCSARGPPFANGACGHPQKTLAGQPGVHDLQQCPRCCVLSCTMQALKNVLHDASQLPQAVRTPDLNVSISWPTAVFAGRSAGPLFHMLIWPHATVAGRGTCRTGFLPSCAGPCWGALCGARRLLSMYAHHACISCMHG